MRCGLAVSATGQTGQSEAILYDRDLVLAERLAHDVEATCQRGITEGALALSWSSAPDGRGQRLLRVDKLGLRLGQRGSECGERFTASRHGRPPSPGDRNSPPPISSACLAPHARWPPWR